MNGWFLLAAPGWLVIVITAAARLHDMGAEQWQLRYHFRRLGLIGVGAIGTVMLLTPFTQDRWFYAPATWRGAMIAWSWALVWLTTEGIPPWYDYVLGVHRKTDAWKAMGWRGRLAGEWRALRASFRPRRRRAPVDTEGPNP